GVRQPGSGRLLHHVAELPGEHEIAHPRTTARAHFAFGRGRGTPLGGADLNEHDVTAHRRVVHPRRDTDQILPAGLLRVNPRTAEEVPHALARNRNPFGAARGDPARCLTRQLADLTLELPHAGLPG